MPTTTLTVYEKLSLARVKLSAMQLVKTGHNKFAGYKYFDLGDFLPATVKIFDDVGLCGVVSYTSELATLTIHDSKNPAQQIVMTSPMADAVLKGCHPVQNLGAAETYQERYEMTGHPDGDPSEPMVLTLTPKQLENVEGMLQATSSNVKAFCKYYGINEVSELPQNKLKAATKKLQQKMDEQGQTLEQELGDVDEQDNFK
jgi:hypothetical protein